MQHGDSQQCLDLVITCGVAKLSLSRHSLSVVMGWGAKDSAPVFMVFKFTQDNGNYYFKKVPLYGYGQSQFKLDQVYKNINKLVN